MKTAILWFRRDLRVADNPALAAALDHRQTDLVNLPNERWEELHRHYLAQLA